MVEKSYSTLLPVILGFSLKPRTISENDTCAITWNIHGAGKVTLATVSGKTTTIISSKLTPTGEMEVIPKFVYPQVTAKSPRPTIPVSSDHISDLCNQYNWNKPVSQDVIVLTSATLPKPGIPIAQDNVTVKAATVLPIIHWLSAEPATIIKGNATTISWEVYQATKVLLNGVEVPPIGSQRVSPAGATTYTLVASNEYYTITKAVGVNVLAFNAAWFEPVVK